MGTEDDQGFDKIMNGLTEALDFADGRIAGAVVREITLQAPDLRAIRRQTASAKRFLAAALGLSPATVRNWEQGRRTIDPATRALYLLIKSNPRSVLDMLARAAADMDPTVAD